jgi:hypothetical protein
MMFGLSEKNAEMRTKRPEKQTGGNVILPAFTSRHVLKHDGVLEATQTAFQYPAVR